MYGGFFNCAAAFCILLYDAKKLCEWILFSLNTTTFLGNGWKCCNKSYISKRNKKIWNSFYVGTIVILTLVSAETCSCPYSVWNVGNVHLYTCYGSFVSSNTAPIYIKFKYNFMYKYVWMPALYICCTHTFRFICIICKPTGKYTCWWSFFYSFLSFLHNIEDSFFYRFEGSALRIWFRIRSKEKQHKTRDFYLQNLFTFSIF